MSHDPINVVTMTKQEFRAIPIWDGKGEEPVGRFKKKNDVGLWCLFNPGTTRTGISVENGAVIRITHNSGIEIKPPAKPTKPKGLAELPCDGVPRYRVGSKGDLTYSQAWATIQEAYRVNDRRLTVKGFRLAKRLNEAHFRILNGLSRNFLEKSQDGPGEKNTQKKHIHG